MSFTKMLNLNKQDIGTEYTYISATGLLNNPVRGYIDLTVFADGPREFELYALTAPLNPNNPMENTEKIGSMQCTNLGNVFNSYVNVATLNNIVRYGMISHVGSKLQIATQTLTVTYNYDQPLLSNFVATGSIDNGVTCSWTLNGISDYFSVIAKKDGQIISTKIGTSETACTFSYSELSIGGDYIFEVTVHDSNSGANLSASTSVSLSMSPLSASGLTIAGSSIDENITLNWTQNEPIDKWVMDVYFNNALYTTYTGTANSLTLNPGALRYTGSYYFLLTVYKKGQTIQLNVTQSFTRVEPTILSLEPSNVNANRDGVITCSWVTQNQQRFVLNVDGVTYTGTTEQSINLPIGAIKTLGNKSISLTIYYTSSWGDTRSAATSTTFNAVGTPNSPILDGYSYYNTSLPTFTWTCVDQFTQFRVQVLLNNKIVDDSNDVVSSIGTYTCSTTLENNTNYVVKVKVKTQYGYWSEWSSKNFTTNFVVANKPSIDVFVSNNAIIINSFTQYSEAFDHCDIYRRTEFTDWVRIAYNLDNNVSYTDQYVGKETYYYKVTSVSTNGGKNDSELAEVSIDVKNFHFTSLEDLNNDIEFIYDPSVSITINRNTSESTYSGVKEIVVDVAEQIYKSGRCQFLAQKHIINAFIKMINEAKVLLYRDGRGEKIFCAVIGSIAPERFKDDWYTISFSFVQLPFDEKDLYTGSGNLSLVFWDGTWKWDGTITWDGEGTLVNDSTNKF